MQGVKEKPNFFHSLKVETERRIRSWWSTKRNADGEVQETPENTALLFILLKEYQAFVDVQVNLLGDKVLALMGDTPKIPLGEYGKTLEYDAEARWLIEREMSSEEWKKYNYDCDQEYFAKKEAEKRVDKDRKR